MTLTLLNIFHIRYCPTSTSLPLLDPGHRLVFEEQRHRHSQGVVFKVKLMTQLLCVNLGSQLRDKIRKVKVRKHMD